MFREPNQQPEIQFEQLLAKIRGSLGSGTGRIGMGGANVLVIILLLVGAVVWISSGLYQVGPREQAALRLFGEYRGNGQLKNSALQQIRLSKERKHDWHLLYPLQ